MDEDQIGDFVGLMGSHLIDCVMYIRCLSFQINVVPNSFPSLYVDQIDQHREAPEILRMIYRGLKKCAYIVDLELIRAKV